MEILAKELKDPLNISLGTQHRPIIITDSGKAEINLMERTMRYLDIKNLIEQFKQKTELLDDVQKRLYPVRNPQKRTAGP